MMHSYSFFRLSSRIVFLAHSFSNYQVKFTKNDCRDWRIKKTKALMSVCFPLVSIWMDSRRLARLTPWTQGLNWRYIRCSGDVHKTFRRRPRHLLNVCMYVQFTSWVLEVYHAVELNHVTNTRDCYIKDYYSIKYS